MDSSEATRIVFSRIQRLEPENVSKIMGCLLVQDNGNQEMIRLAFAPDALLQSQIEKAKKHLGLIPYLYNSHLPLQISQLSNSNSSPSRPAFTPPGLYWSPSPPVERPSSLPLSALTLQLPGQVEQQHTNYLNYRPNSVSPNYHHEQLNLRDQISLLNETNNMFPSVATEFLYPDYINYGNKVGVDQLNSMVVGNGDISRAAATHDIFSEPVMPAVWKPCVYFARGYCKHGYNCRFLHGYARQENLINDNNNSASSLYCLSGSPTESRSGDEVFLSGTLERLEMELQELLRGKRVPISIAALPQLYYERFGKTLQAEGYLTESQRHGKAGYSLTKLLARLKNTVTLIDRPHGQHAVVLAEDAHRFTVYRSGVDDLGGVSSGSRQIYLTFPAESTFTEEDVSNYFRTYGPVHDVRIPYQQKRMFGFVTFIYPETVKTILTKGNPHYVCGARVLVKPYREKGKLGDRKCPDRVEQQQPKYVPANDFDAKDYDHMNFGLRIFDNSEIIRRHMEEQEQAIELERRRMTELHLSAAEAQRVRQLAETQAASIAAVAAAVASTGALVSHALQSQGTNGLVHSEEESKAVDDLNNFPSTDHFGYVLDVLDNNEDEPTHGSNEDRGSYGHNLPENPFANITGSNGNGTLYNSEETKNSTGESMIAMPKTSGQTSAASVINKELACSMCLDALVDPKQLECNHVFCLKCMPKVGEMSNIDQCPICGQYEDNQYIKLSGTVDLQDFLGKRVIPTSSVW